MCDKNNICYSMKATLLIQANLACLIGDLGQIYITSILFTPPFSSAVY